MKETTMKDNIKFAAYQVSVRPNEDMQGMYDYDKWVIVWVRLTGIAEKMRGDIEISMPEKQYQELERKGKALNYGTLQAVADWLGIGIST